MTKKICTTNNMCLSFFFNNVTVNTLRDIIENENKEEHSFHL